MYLAIEHEESVLVLTAAASTAPEALLWAAADAEQSLRPQLAAVAREPRE